MLGVIADARARLISPLALDAMAHAFAEENDIATPGYSRLRLLTIVNIS